MNLRPNNPFAAGYVLPNYQRLYRQKLVYEKAPDDKFHIVIEGEELDKLAFKYYGDSKYWWIIYDINNNVIDEPFTLTAGSVLIIPSLDRLISTQL